MHRPGDGLHRLKFIGLRVIAEMRSAGRARDDPRVDRGCRGLRWSLFAVAPAGVKVAAMFLNGLCLGMIWGLVFSYMEGRRSSEILGAVLCASFIVSSGAVKSVRCS